MFFCESGKYIQKIAKNGRSNHLDLEVASERVREDLTACKQNIINSARDGKQYIGDIIGTGADAAGRVVRSEPVVTGAVWGASSISYLVFSAVAEVPTSALNRHLFKGVPMGAALRDGIKSPFAGIGPLAASKLPWGFLVARTESAVRPIVGSESLSLGLGGAFAAAATHPAKTLKEIERSGVTLEDLRKTRGNLGAIERLSAGMMPGIARQFAIYSIGVGIGDAANANTKNFLANYAGVEPGFASQLAGKVAGMVTTGILISPLFQIEYQGRMNGHKGMAAVRAANLVYDPSKSAKENVKILLKNGYKGSLKGIPALTLSSAVMLISIEFDKFLRAKGEAFIDRGI